MSGFLYTRSGKKYLERHYNELGESTHVIANLQSTYPNEVVRALKFHDIELRTKSEAQKKAMATGRNRHPTEGSQRPQETRNRIGEGVSLSWSRLTPDQRLERSRRSQQQWENLTQEEKAEFRAAALEALREAATNGSKLELYLASALREKGWHVETRARIVGIPVDLFLRGKCFAIFVDGPGHHMPIWGEKRLIAVRKQDDLDNQALMRAGYSVIRITNTARNLSEIQQRVLLPKVLRAIELRKTEQHLTLIGVEDAKNKEGSQ